MSTHGRPHGRHQEIARQWTILLILDEWGACSLRDIRRRLPHPLRPHMRTVRRDLHFLSHVFRIEEWREGHEYRYRLAVRRVLSRAARQVTGGGLILSG